MAGRAYGNNECDAMLKSIEEEDLQSVLVVSRQSLLLFVYDNYVQLNTRILLSSVQKLIIQTDA